MSEQLIKHFEDLWFSVKAKKNSHWVDFEIVKISGINDNGKPEYNNDTIMFSENIDDASIFAYGSVKWDGCSNWDIGEKDVMIHSCDKEHLLNIGKILAACWDWAAELLADVWYVKN